MAHKVQAQAGGSLSDIYDVKGGQAPIDRLVTSEVQLIHEMGRTIQSERFSSTIRRREATGILQSANFDEVLSDLPAGVTRILGLVVLSSGVSQLAVVTVSLRDPLSGRELPIFAWEAGDINKTVRVDEDGGGVSNIGMALADDFHHPVSLIVGPDQPQRVPDIALRGTTTAFGAGTVDIILLLHLAFAAIGGISSRGLPIPSW